MAVRRKVSFCEAVYDGMALVEDVTAVLVEKPVEARQIWDQGKIPVMVDPLCQCREAFAPPVLIDAILAKKNLGTSIHDAPLVIALGPGFEAGVDAHYVVETNRGHRLGRLLSSGKAEPNTGVPGKVMGHSSARVLRSPVDGPWQNRLDIGDIVRKGECVGTVNDLEVKAAIDGILRGSIHPGIDVTKGLKIGDIDPRPVRENCFTISEKALAIAGGVLEGILRKYG